MSPTPPTIFSVKALSAALLIGMCWGPYLCQTAGGEAADASANSRNGVRSGGIEKKPVKNFFPAKGESTDNQNTQEAKNSTQALPAGKGQGTSPQQKGEQGAATKTKREFVKEKEENLKQGNVSNSGEIQQAALKTSRGAEDQDIDEDIRVKAIAEAPLSMKGLVDCQQHKDYRCAELYADRFVKYMVNLMTAVREITHLIGEAYVRLGQLDEEDWVGAEQLLDMQMAEVSKNDPLAFKLTHELALEQIKPDPTQKAEIFVFCSLSNRYCREMSPDIERLWQVAKADPRLKMVMVTLKRYPDPWIKSYRQYTGLSVPIREGANIAKAFRIAFVPAMVIYSPGTKTSYIRTGQEDFVRMYETVRTVQGLPKALTPPLEKLIQTPIGNIELLKVKEKKSGFGQSAALGQQAKQGVSLAPISDRNRGKDERETAMEKF